MIYDILEGKLAAEGYIPGEKVFRNMMPPDITVGIMIKAPLTGIPINPHIPGYYHTSLQVVCRSPDPVEVLEIADHVQRILHVEVTEKYPASPERGPAHIELFQAKTLPIQFPRLEGNFLETSQHFETAFGFKPAST